MPAPVSETPAKKQTKWTADEDSRIIDLRGKGMKWDDISKNLPGRSPISCRLHYQNYLERRPEWDEERKNKLARLYERFRQEMWQKVAEEMGMPWRAVEGMHWALGEVDMARRAGVTPFAFAATTVDTAHGGSRGSSRHAHSRSQGNLSREGGPGRGYGRGIAITPSRPLVSRRENIPVPHHHYPPPPELPPEPYPYVQHGGPLAPMQTQTQPQRPGMLPSVAELTTGVSPYSTPAYSVGAPSASPVHSTTASPGPFPPIAGYPPLEPAGSKRRRSPDPMSVPPETTRRRQMDPQPPYDYTGQRYMP
ncbi:hypothetical protein F4778DRAFT_462176 [Xylariomycetidae sp. FL2044]|nr:hypothetical protein F4778DRAFT_462176 [Xylariomycetidae sp. FL2044]